MIITLVSWLWMLFIFGTMGMLVNKLVVKVEPDNSQDIFNIIWYGIILSIVYAQSFSIVYKLGVMSLGIISLVGLFSLIILIKDYVNMICNICIKIREHKKQFFISATIICIILFIGVIYTIQAPIHYDTYLYHAQAIRWLEEYGIVKGLGNLHNRFAYNSAFMCLQALFSFRGIYGDSMHSLNGFFWVFMAIYAILSMKIIHYKKVFLSDLFRILMIIYLFFNTLDFVSSPHTDMLPLIMVLYILIRWIDLKERNYTGIISYGILCLMGVSAVTVKLSAIMILVLVIRPAFIMLKEKRGKMILTFLIAGILIVTPFIIRNVMISGYLVYPYASIDIFNVDWKMNKEEVINDNHEIIAWGRQLNDVGRYDEPMSVWLPVWMEKSGNYLSLLMILNLLLIPVTLLLCFHYLTKKKYDDCLLLITLLVLFLSWFLTAPLPRYGLVYLYLIPFFIAGNILERKHIRIRNDLNNCHFIYAIIMTVLSILCIKGLVELPIGQYIIVPSSYQVAGATKEVDWENLKIHITTESDQGSYLAFPSTPYEDRLQRTELRGEDLSEGFRRK